MHRSAIFLIRLTVIEKAPFEKSDTCQKELKSYS